MGFIDNVLEQGAIGSAVGGTIGGLLGGGGGAVGLGGLGGTILGGESMLDGGVEGGGFGGLFDKLQGITGTEKYKPSIDLVDPYQEGREKLMGVLGERLSGQRASAGEQAITAGLQQNLQNTISAIRSAPGVSPGLKARMIARATERTGAEVAQKGAVMRAQEEQADIGQLGRLQQEGGQAYLAPEKLRAGLFEQGQERRQQLVRAVGQGIGAAAKGGS